MKTYVTYDATDYVVRKEQNQVICQLKFHIDLPDDIAKLTSYLIYFDEDIKKFFANLNLYNCCEDSNYVVINGITYGYADCQNGDEFDDVFGKKLSQTRAQMKAFDIATKVYNELSSKYIEFVRKFDALAFSTNSSADKCSLHANDLILNKYEF